MPDFEGSAWWAVMAPRGVPGGTVTSLNREIDKALALPDSRKRLAALDVEPGGGSPAEVGAYLQSERAKWAAVVKDAGIVGE
jgi:tripartite-type tricarboxylate transporter receptor subunit TctC